jgi:KaiC/GvpD/RAD55 family RecA-like ATPase
MDLPLSIQLFLYVNIFLIFLACIIVWEIKRESPSPIWNHILKGNVLDVAYAVGLAVLLSHPLLVVNGRSLWAIALFHTFATVMLVFVIHSLVRPVLRREVEFSRLPYLLLYPLSLLLTYLILRGFHLLRYPPSFQAPPLLVAYLLSVFLILLYFGTLAFRISESYKRLGFVRRPFFAVGIGTASILLSMTFLSFQTYPYRQTLYYPLFFYLFAGSLTFSYYFHFMIGYPSLLDPKWKSYLPFSANQVMVAIFLLFLGASTSLALEGSGALPATTLSIFPSLLLLALGWCLLFSWVLIYQRRIQEKTRLRYWHYLKLGLYIHLLTSFYVLSLIAFFWGEMSRQIQILSSVFWALVFSFYLTYALDLRNVLQHMGIPVRIDLPSLSLYSTFGIASCLFIYVGAVLPIPSTPLWLPELTASGAVLFFIAIFLISYITYLSVTHRGFEELLLKSLWTQTSYLASFGAFVVVYLLYLSLGPLVERFPLHDLFFVGYFLILLLEIVSIRTLSFEEGGVEERRSIEDFLHYHMERCLRTDFLEETWARVRDRLEGAGHPLGHPPPSLRPANRRFEWGGASEDHRRTISVLFLLEMYREGHGLEKITTEVKPLSVLKEEIEEVLGDGILSLPPFLRQEFEVERHYSSLFQETINDLLKQIETFIPRVQMASIVPKLARLEPTIETISFVGEEIRLPEETSMTREAFVTSFKLTVQALEELFPFEYVLLRGVARQVIDERLARYGFSYAELMDLVPVGIEAIDELCNGGLVKRTATLLLTEESRGKTRFLDTFVAQGLHEKDKNIFLSSTRPIREIRRALLTECGDLSDVAFLDLHEALHTPKKLGKAVSVDGGVVIPAKRLFVQHALVQAIKSHPREVHKRVVIDIYGDLLKRPGGSAYLTDLPKLISGMRRWNCTSVVTLDPYLLNQKGLEEVERNFDNVFLLSGAGKKFSATILRLHGGTPKVRTTTL